LRQHVKAAGDRMIPAAFSFGRMMLTPQLPKYAMMSAALMHKYGNDNLV
jgi:hypothetical protein